MFGYFHCNILGKQKARQKTQAKRGEEIDMCKRQ